MTPGYSNAVLPNTKEVLYNAAEKFIYSHFFQQQRANLDVAETPADLPPLHSSAVGAARKLRQCLQIVTRRWS